jgi:hypothetical protein
LQPFPFREFLDCDRKFLHQCANPGRHGALPVFAVSMPMVSITLLQVEKLLRIEKPEESKKK